MSTLIIHEESPEKWEALKAFLHALKIKFEVKDNAEYDPKFVTMVVNAENQIKNGESLSLSSKEFDDLWK